MSETNYNYCTDEDLKGQLQSNTDSIKKHQEAHAKIQEELRKRKRAAIEAEGNQPFLVSFTRQELEQIARNYGTSCAVGAKAYKPIKDNPRTVTL